MEAIKNEVVEVFGRQWLIHEAVSMDAAETEIAYAAATGSVGSRHFVDDVLIADVSCIAARGE